MYRPLSEEKEEFARRLLLVVIGVIILIFIGTLFYHFSEGWTYLDSLYFSTISLTARGFSGQHPSNWASVLFSVFYLLVGVSVVIYTISSIIAFYSIFYQKKFEEKFQSFVNQVKNHRRKHDKWIMLNIKNKQGPEIKH